MQRYTSQNMVAKAVMTSAIALLGILAIRDITYPYDADLSELFIQRPFGIKHRERCGQEFRSHPEHWKGNQ